MPADVMSNDDFAVIELNEQISTLLVGARPICFLQAYEPIDGESATVAGFGQLHSIFYAHIRFNRLIIKIP